LIDSNRNELERLKDRVWNFKHKHVVEKFLIEFDFTASPNPEKFEALKAEICEII
jgi:dynactin complex subunit